MAGRAMRLSEASAHCWLTIKRGKGGGLSRAGGRTRGVRREDWTRQTFSSTLVEADEENNLGGNTSGPPRASATVRALHSNRHVICQAVTGEGEGSPRHLRRHRRGADGR